MAVTLARLLEQATPPLRIAGIPPGIISASDWDVTDEVLATWPDMARLLIDMADALRAQYENAGSARHMLGTMEALLARFAALDKQAAR